MTKYIFFNVIFARKQEKCAKTRTHVQLTETGQMPIVLCRTTKL